MSRTEDVFEWNTYCHKGDAHVTLDTDNDWLNGNLSEVIQRLQTILDSAPEDMRRLVEIDVSAEDRVRLEIGYVRPMTMEEVRREEDEATAQASARLAEENKRDRQLYERLKRKFET